MWRISAGRNKGSDLYLTELRDTQVNMFTTVFIGNSDTELIHGKLVTKRGYHIERNTDIK